MAAISAFRVTQHSQIFSLFFRNQIQCIELYQLLSSQALLDLRRGYYTEELHYESTFEYIFVTDEVHRINRSLKSITQRMAGQE